MEESKYPVCPIANKQNITPVQNPSPGRKEVEENIIAPKVYPKKIVKGKMNESEAAYTSTELKKQPVPLKKPNRSTRKTANRKATASKQEEKGKSR